MIDFEIGYDEYIILETEDVVWISNNDIEIDKMALTNRNIYIQYSEREEGFFVKKGERRVTTMPLYGIKVMDGQLMVGHVWKWDSGTCLQIQHAKGEGLFYFRYGGKKKVIEWENEIKRLFEIETSPDSSGEGVASTLAGDFFNNVGEALGGMLSGSRLSNNNHSRMQSETAYREKPKVQRPKEKIRAKFCPNCGTKIIDGAKFCGGCGKTVYYSDETQEDD